MKRLAPILLVTLAGCVSTMDAAEAGLVGAHRALMEADAQFAPLYEQAREHAREESGSWEERDAKIEKWETARKSFVTVGNALKTAALSLAIARDGFDANWEAQFCKLVKSLDELRENLTDIGVKIPPEAASAILAIRAAVGVGCDG